MSFFVLRERRQSKAEDSRSRMLTEEVRGWGAGRPAPLYFRWQAVMAEASRRHPGPA